MSPVWMQYDEPSAQRPFEQRPEQHCVLDVQVLLAVVHPPETIGWQVPPLQLPVQHALPATGHAAPMVRHCRPPHCPETQEPLQQSVLPTHAAPDGAQRAMDEPQVLDVVSQTPEQHEDPNEQDPPKAVQLTLTLPSGPKLATDPSPPPAPLELEEPAPSPPPDVVPSVSAPSSPAAPPSPPTLPSIVEASPCVPPDSDPSDPQPAITIASAEKAHQPKRFIMCSLSILGKKASLIARRHGSPVRRLSPQEEGASCLPRHSDSRSW
jgi:hypothetical protein